MKKLIAIIVASLFVLSVAGLSLAQEKKEEKKAAPAKAEEKKAEPAKKEKVKAKVLTVTGDVTAVDAAAKTVTVKGKDKDVTLDTSGIKDLKVKVGDKVTAKYTEKDGKNVAKSIKAAAAKKAEPKKEEKKAEPKKEEKKPAEPAKK